MSRQAEGQFQSVKAIGEASRHKFAQALYEIGLNYATGHGVDRNLVEAHKWLNLATVHGSNRAAIDRDDLTQELTRREIRQALQMAREWQDSHPDTIKI
jgi:TPR repeat protein